jgi:anti-anti-sigma factor
MSEAKHVRLEEAGETLIVTPIFTSGRFTEGEVVGEWNQILNKVEGVDVKRVVVDLGFVPYFGSTLLDWIVQMWKRLQGKGGSLAVCNASQVGREVLVIARFDKLWEIHDSRQAAMESFGHA